MTRLLLLLAALALPAQATTKTEATPMVWAFQHFCADETFTLDEARLAIAIAGGKQRGPTASTHSPLSMSVTVWDISIGGRKLGIALSGERMAAGPHGVADMVACTVYANGPDDAGIAALRKWAAVAPAMTPAPRIAIYRFTSEQGAHIPVPQADAGSAGGHVWQLNVTGGKFATVSLMRFFKTRENS
jgi:hypothetical protein